MIADTPRPRRLVIPGRYDRYGKQKRDCELERDRVETGLPVAGRTEGANMTTSEQGTNQDDTCVKTLAVTVNRESNTQSRMVPSGEPDTGTPGDEPPRARSMAIGGEVMPPANRCTKTWPPNKRSCHCGTGVEPDRAPEEHRKGRAEPSSARSVMPGGTDRQPQQMAPAMEPEERGWGREGYSSTFPTIPGEPKPDAREPDHGTQVRGRGSEVVHASTSTARPEVPGLSTLERAEYDTPGDVDHELGNTCILDSDPDWVQSGSRAESLEHEEELGTEVAGTRTKTRRAKMYLTCAEKAKLHVGRRTRNGRTTADAAVQGPTTQPSSAGEHGQGASHPYNLRSRTQPMTREPERRKPRGPPVTRNERRRRSKAKRQLPRPDDGLSNESTVPPKDQKQLKGERLPPNPLDTDLKSHLAKKDANRRRSLRRKAVLRRYGRTTPSESPSGSMDGAEPVDPDPESESGYDSGAPVPVTGGVASRLRSSTDKAKVAARAPSSANVEDPPSSKGVPVARGTTLNPPDAGASLGDAIPGRRSNVATPTGDGTTPDPDATPVKRVSFELGGDDGFPVVMFQYTTEDWIREQSRDVVLSRIKELKVLHPSEAPSQSTIACEAPEVKYLCRGWDMLCMHDGVLCRELSTV